MSKKFVVLLASAMLIFAASAISLGQETTTVTKTVQNPDGTFTVIEYPVGKEVQVILDPIGINADGLATILRDDAGTRIKINLNKLPADMTTLNLYAVNENGVVTLLGPVNVANGTASFNTTTPLTKFMIVASPEAKLAAYEPNTTVFFRSAVPTGFAVVPRVVNPEGEKVSATTEAVPVAAAKYTVPMLGIPAFKTGDDTKMKIKFAGPLTGARANVFITPRKDGPTEVKIRFHDLKDAPSGKTYHVWAVSPSNEFIKLGQVVNAAGRNEAEIKSEVALADFGLFITMEDATGELLSPLGESIGIVEIIK